MTRPTIQQFIRSGLVSSLVFIPLLALTACGGQSDAGESAPSASSDAPTTSETDVAAATTPAEVGQAIADLYIGGFEAVNEALADHPSADAAVPLLREIHDRHVTDLVALGRRVEEMSDSDKAIVQAAVSRAQSGLRYDKEIKPVYEEYTALNQHYVGTGALRENEDFRSLFTGFNILTQYAFFDLLKRQKPDEAERLGIE